MLKPVGIISHKTVDKHLGPDRLAGLKALDPSYCRQLIFACMIFILIFVENCL